MTRLLKDKFSLALLALIVMIAIMLFFVRGPESFYTTASTSDATPVPDSNHSAREWHYELPDEPIKRLEGDNEFVWDTVIEMELREPNK